ncbi:MAG TPA: hypothetical protein VFL93_03510 [Longimicrobiaceae bacterium]|nr:hypothetical protein [Longimicrobiaceae bacterium]
METSEHPASGQALAAFLLVGALCIVVWAIYAIVTPSSEAARPGVATPAVEQAPRAVFPPPQQVSLR